MLHSRKRRKLFLSLHVDVFHGCKSTGWYAIICSKNGRRICKLQRNKTLKSHDGNTSYWSYQECFFFWVSHGSSVHWESLSYNHTSENFHWSVENNVTIQKALRPKSYGEIIWESDMIDFISFNVPVQNSDHSWPCERILRFLVSWRKAEYVLLLSSWLQLEGSFPYLQLTSWTGNRMCSAQENRPSYDTSRNKQSRDVIRQYNLYLPIF